MVWYKTIMRITERNFLYALTAIRSGLFSFLERELKNCNAKGLTPSLGDILFVLDLKGPMTVGELARKTSRHKSTVSSVVKSLEALGLVTRVRDGQDLRRASLEITREASTLRQALYEISEKMRQMLFKGFTEEEKHALFRLMERACENVGPEDIRRG
jgi:DNA-binding MarR family transcriptional regulator